MRRALFGTLLILIAVQLLGGTAFASACLEPCPDDCPPVCKVCTTCTIAVCAIAQNTAGTPLRAVHGFAPQAPASPLSPLTDDIFHVPLRG